MGRFTPHAPRVWGDPQAGAPKGRDVDFDFYNEKGKPMNEATQDSYRKLAQHFYANRLGGKPPTPKTLADSLKAVAGEYRPAYWRRLRNALAFDQREKGYADAAERLDGTKNPVTDGKSPSAEVKPKQPRTRRVTDADHAKLVAHFVKQKDPKTLAALTIARYTGARPAEFKGIRIVDGRVFIEGAKKSHASLRGADRTLVLDAEGMRHMESALRHVQDMDVGTVQDRIRAAGKALWPQRKSVPTLYSYRHQLGSNLKAAGLDRKQVAYLMGHQATSSVDRYGNAKMKNGKAPLPSMPEGTELSQIRENHTDMKAFAPGELDMPLSPAEKNLGAGQSTAKGKGAGKPKEKPSNRQTPTGGSGLNM